MFFGSFTEKNKKEIELKGVDREDFHLMLKALYDQPFEVKENMRLLESLLVIADRFDLKAIIDRVEVLIVENNSEFSQAKILLFVDRNDAFRFIKLHTEVFLNYGGNVSCVSASEEYHQLSEEAKSSCDIICEMIPNVEVAETLFWYRSPDSCNEMNEVTDILEGKDLVASGCSTTVFDINSKQDGILSSVYPLHFHFDEAIDIGGLLWSVDAKCNVLEHVDRKNRHLISLMLVVNQDLPSKFEWTAEGIMEIEATFLARGGITLMDQSDITYSTEILDEKGELINPYLTNPYPIKKQFSFALDSNNRKGLTPIVCVIKRAEENGEEELEGWNAPKLFVKTRIHL
ncbi:hypothetical protein PMAYCL1PPCAC_05350, partial [Pristionchus mayeri]